jgi:hypothetical protein
VAEQRPFKPLVVGSTPTAPTNFVATNLLTGNSAPIERRRVPRVVGEEQGFQGAACDERGRGGPSSEGTIAFRLWTATLYSIEMTGGQNFGERQRTKF